MLLPQAEDFSTVMGTTLLSLWHYIFVAILSPIS